MFALTTLLSSALLLGRGDPSWDHASISAYAVNTATGKIVLDENSEKSLLPASCMKIVVTAAALQILGPETRFSTELEYDGVLEGGVLQGNLYIHGGGDPCLGSDRAQGALSWHKQIAVWVEAIQKLGIKRIEGEVIGDGSRWEKAMTVPSWCWEDVGNYYGAGACGLSFHENAYTLFFRPGKEGEKAEIIRHEPTVPGLTFQNEVKTGAVGSGDQACIYGAEYSPTIYVRGTIPAGVEEFSIRGAIPDPAKACGDMLAKGLEENGISIGHQNLPGGKRVIFHTTYSPTVKEIVYWTNQKSINLYAEHLLKKIGEVVFKEGSTAAGIKAVTDFWRSQKINLDGFKMADGSGLSRKNLVTAQQLVSMLQVVKKSKTFSDFMHSLPEENEHVRTKDGSMAFIKGYVGYSDDVAFAILVNQCLDPEARKKIKQFLSDFSQFDKALKKKAYTNFKK